MALVVEYDATAAVRAAVCAAGYHTAAAVCSAVWLERRIMILDYYSSMFNNRLLARAANYDPNLLQHMYRSVACAAGYDATAAGYCCSLCAINSIACRGSIFIVQQD